MLFDNPVRNNIQASKLQSLQVYSRFRDISEFGNFVCLSQENVRYLKSVLQVFPHSPKTMSRSFGLFPSSCLRQPAHI